MLWPLAGLPGVQGFLCGPGLPMEWSCEEQVCGLGWERGQRCPATEG